METEALLTFLGLVALGSYVQTVTGFAIAMVIIGGATALGLAPIAFTANVVSFVAMANILVAVHRLHSHIDRKIMLFGSTGVLVLTAAGLWLLNHLSVAAVDLLETLLGIVILASGAILIVRPHPRKQVSGNAAHLLAGGVGGLLNGMLQTLCYSLDRQLPAPAGQQPVNRRIPDFPERSTSDLQESVARPVAFSSGTLPAKERYDCRDAEPSNAISQ